MNILPSSHYAWLVWSVFLLLIWLLVYLSLARASKHEMLVVSAWTALLGLTEPLFVPAYWNPPSLFDLAQRTGFDLESVIFAWSVGGLAAVLYEAVFKSAHRTLQGGDTHRYHTLALLAAPLIFLPLLLVPFNPIYAVILAFLGGGLATWYCRPDLIGKMALTSVLFTVFYFFSFLLLNLLYPDYVTSVWNLAALSGVLVIGVPLEELIFAAGFGFLWASFYEHATDTVLQRT